MTDATFETRRSSAARVAAFVTGESLRGAIALALLVVAFLWTPISRYDSVYYSSADLLQDFSLLRVQGEHTISNQLMSDGVTEMKPWLMYNRDELAEGRVPLWNPWNGAGCPHFANYQSAVFSPFSLPGYLFGTKLGLVLGAFLKLWACGFFTFLFLKALRLRFVPALIGASAFAFCGHNILLISFPHVAAQATLPAGMYFAELVLQRFARTARAFASGDPPGSPGPFAPIESNTSELRERDVGPTSLRAPLTGLALTFAVGLLTGQPEVFYFSFVLIATYIAARMLWLLFELRRVEGTVRRLLGLALKLSFAGLVGAGLAAFQLLPFFEFLENSRLYEQRSLVQTPLSTEYWPLLFFPNVLGNPSTPYVISLTVPFPNFELINMAYTGPLVVFLAGAALLFARRSRLVVFFAVGAAAWVFYAYDLFGAAKFFALIPTVDIAPMNRSQGVWAFCVAVLAALAVDHAMRATPVRRAWFAVTVLGGALVYLVTFLIGADRVIEANSLGGSTRHMLFSEFVPVHVERMTAFFGVGVIAFTTIAIVRWRWMQTIGAIAVLLCTFLATGWLLRNYNPVCEDRLYYPVTPAMRELMARVGDERLAILGEDKLPPDVNLIYRLQTIDNYDGMWVQKYDHLYRDQFGETHNWRTMVKGSERALKLFGVKWVLAKWGWNWIDSGFNPTNRGAGQKFIPLEVTGGTPVTQTLKAHKDGLQSVAFFMSVHLSAHDAHLDFTIEDADTHEVVGRDRMTVEQVRSTVYTGNHQAFPFDYSVGLPGRQVVFRFPPVAHSKGRQYKVTLSSDDAGPGNCVLAWGASVLAYGEGQSSRGARPLRGELLFDFSYNGDRFEDVARVGDYVLYRYKDAVPKYQVVRGAVVAEDDEEALALLRVTNFDPSQIVVLSDDPTMPAEVRKSLGPVDNSKRRLVKFENDDKVYVVDEAGRRLVHVQNEVVFLINKFTWQQIENVSPSDFEGWPRTLEDLQAQTEAGLRVVVPEVRGQAPLVVHEESPTRTVMELDRLWPSYVVISQAWYPGWKARVNGEEVPVWRANYAFDAIAVPAGRNTIELAYEPDSLRRGIWIGVVAALAGAIALVRRPRWGEVSGSTV